MSQNDQQTALVPPEDTYAALLADLRSIITRGHGRAAAAINAEMVQTYWHIGERLVREEQGGQERAAYGTQLLSRLGRTLATEFGRGFAERSLQNMRQFYLAYQIPSAVRTELSWSHYRVLMRLPVERRSFYEQGCVTARWSSRELERQINSLLFERALRSRSPKEIVTRTLTEPPAILGGDVFKDPYILDFLGLQESYSEHDLESALVHHIERFLLELGIGFSQRAPGADVGGVGGSQGQH